MLYDILIKIKYCIYLKYWAVLRSSDCACSISALFIVTFNEKLYIYTYKCILIGIYYGELWSSIYYMVKLNI